MKVQLVGCSHHHSSLAVRERLSFNRDQTCRALDLWQERFPRTEAVLLSTCNRTELYAAGDERLPSHHDIADFLTSFHHVPLADVFDELFEQSGEGAVRHLFTVAASLDSMVLGEAQILAQVKQAYELACARSTAGPLTHDVFQAALRVAKRVAGETTINQRRLSVASVAVADFAREVFERFDDKQVLVIGAGETAEETLRYLVDEGARQITVLNRHSERAQSLAARWKGAAEPWERLPEAVIAADLVVSTTGAADPIFQLADYRKIEAQRYQRPLFILDLAVPRDFDPAIGECLGVYLYSIDDLREACEANRKARQDEWPAAEKIIGEETARFMREFYHRATAPTVRRLYESCGQFKEDELRRLLNKLPDLDAKSRDEIAQAFDRLVNKMLHPPLESLRDESRHGPPHGLLDALRRLFQLKD
jgi:glutamyl-tRNA reductase